MRLVLDTNVLVAALATRGACAALFEQLVALHDYAVDDALLEEVHRVLLVKFRVPPALAAEALALLERTGVRVTPSPLDIPVCRDPDDDRVLALARAFEAELLVTGDADLLVLHPWEGIAIVPPREFWARQRPRDPTP